MTGCTFCAIVSSEISAAVVLNDDSCLAFLDHRPLFVGHTLIVPKAHHETLADLPSGLMEPFFTSVQRLSIAVQSAMGAAGTFIAINNKVSQSVPHLHAHIVPRRPKDGLRGFFWPRATYENEQHMIETAGLINSALESS